MRGLGVATVLLVAPVLTGCVNDLGDPLEEQSLPGAAEWVEDTVWDTSGNYSKTLLPGAFEALPVELALMQSHDGTAIATAVWRPDVPEGTKVPVVLDVGPYYSNVIGSVFGQEKVLFVEGLVKHGYAYAHVAIRGTSTSAGCMEFFGPNEQKDVDAAVTHFGTQPWSNGNVALYGVSYDGTTPWIAAAFGNPHLKTIVPVSGLTDVAELMFRNGTSELRGPIMHSIVYWLSFGVGVPYLEGSLTPAAHRASHWAEQFCPETARGFATGPYTYATGDRESPGPLAGYWEDRNFRERVKENYRGSVYLVHGLQDWNVEATMAYPFVNELEAQGIEVKHMLGQWAHDWPDRASREASVRWDWAEMLLRWFDHYLYEHDTPTGPGADVEDNYGLWRTEESWPPRDAVLTTYFLGAGLLASEAQADGRAVLGAPARMAPVRLPPPAEVRFELGRAEKDLRFAGLPQLGLTVTPTNPHGGNLYVELLDIGRNGAATRAAHGTMNIRYYAGGTEPQQLTPGAPVQALIEFFPADVLVPAGHRLVLRVVADTAGTEAGGDPRLPSPTPTPIVVEWGGEKSVLKLPIIERDAGTGQYPGQPDHS